MIRFHGRGRITGVSIGKLRIEFYDLWTERYGIGWPGSWTWEGRRRR